MAKAFASDSAKNLFNSAKNLGTTAGQKISSTVNNVGKVTADTAGKISSATADEANKLKNQLETYRKEIAEKGFSENSYKVTTELLVKLAHMPVVFVDREAFLRKTFGDSEYIEQIVANGPQSVFTVDSLRNKANEVIKSSTRKTSVASFAAGLPSNVAVMAATTAADVTQFFAFALNMAQKIAYLFGEDQLFKSFSPTDDLVRNDGASIPEDAQVKMISYLGVMLGVSGASNLIVQTSKTIGANAGKKIARQALTKTTWYPLVKKIGSILGYKVTKKTVEGVVSKSVPIVGGIISGGITYASFRPLGGRLADVFVDLLNGKFDGPGMELNEEFLKTIQPGLDNLKDLDSDIIEGDFSEPDAGDQKY